MASLIFVTAFMTNINRRNDRGIQKYIDLGHKLLSVRIPQIVFMEQAVFDEHFRSRYAHLANKTDDKESSPNFSYGGKTYEYVVFGRLTFVFFEKNDMYFESHRSGITEFSVHTPHPNKDTLDYMFVQCHKTEWVAMALELDLARFGSRMLGDMYMWVDFGIRHMFPSALFNCALMDSISK
jgi:hypothetical protein